MEELAVYVLDGFADLRVRDGFVAALVVGFVGDDGVVDRGQMHPDLVCAAGFYLDVEESEFFEPLPYLPKRKSAAAVRGDRHLRPMPAVTGDGTVDLS